MQVILQVAVVTLLLFLAQEVLRRAGKWVSWCLFFVVPLVLTPYWLTVNEFDLFQWAKIYTVFFCICWGTLLRFTSIGNRPWACFTIPLLLAANILEATTLDLFGRGLAHNVNAVAGLLLIATMRYSLHATRIDSASRWQDLHSGTTRSWVCGYTIWNWTFVYLNYPALTGHHTAVLAVGLIVGLIDPRRWTQARAYTLGLNLLFTATFYTGMTSWLDTSNWSDEGLGIVAAAIALAFVAGCSVRAFRNRDQQLPVITSSSRGESRWTIRNGSRYSLQQVI